jgi:hypothetical protein
MEANVTVAINPSHFFPPWPYCHPSVIPVQMQADAAGKSFLVGVRAAFVDSLPKDAQKAFYAGGLLGVPPGELRTRSQ